MPKDLGITKNHIGGNFEWEIEPSCSCGRLKEAVEERFLFVSNFTDGGDNQFYMMPLDSGGDLFRSEGLPISNCPWCGDKIKARKKYASP